MTGKQLKKLRKARGLSQGALAELLQVDRSAVTKWETDAAPITKSRALMISWLITKSSRVNGE